MVRIQCPRCDYETVDAEAQIVVELLRIHATSHAQNVAGSNQPKLERPRIDIGVEEEVWNNFMRRWEAFRIGSGIEQSTAPMQFLQCATESLGDLVLKYDPEIHTKDIKTVISVMRSFAVIPVASGVRRAELLQLRQHPDENIRSFAAKVIGKAETCAYKTTTKCDCGRDVTADYTSETVKDVLLAGIADLDIRREALSLRDIPKMSVNNVISFIEDCEMARNATPSVSLSALSSYKSDKKMSDKNIPSPGNQSVKPSDRTIPCPSCRKPFNQFKQRKNGSWNTKPFAMCIDCWRRQRPSSKAIGALLTDDHDSPPDCVVQQVSALESIDPSKIMSKSELKRSNRSCHPRVRINVATSDKKIISPVMAVADSGAMSNLWGLREFLASGFSSDDLTPVTIDIKAANRVNLNVLGYLNAHIFA